MPRLDLMQVRRGTTLQWSTANPVLAPGEPGWDHEADVLKFGDLAGTAWNDLPGVGGGGGGGGSGLPQDGDGTFSTEFDGVVVPGSVAFGYANDGGVIRSFAPPNGYPYGGDTYPRYSGFTFGSAQGAGSLIQANASGAIVGGIAKDGGVINGFYAGSFVWGIAKDAGSYLGPNRPLYRFYDGIRHPSFAFGLAENGAQFSAYGGIAMGWADGAGAGFGNDEPGGFVGGWVQGAGSQVYVAGAGAFAWGTVVGGGQIFADYGSAAFGYSRDTARIEAGRDGTFATGDAIGSYLGSYGLARGARIRAGGRGAQVFGYCRNSKMLSQAKGSQVGGHALTTIINDPAGYSKIETGYGAQGAQAFGYARDGGFLNGAGQGSTALGHAFQIGSKIESSGAGAFAHGAAAAGGVMTASGSGSTVSGGASGAGAVMTASGFGSFAQGYAAAGDTILASAIGAVQFAPGTNAVPNSVAVGEGLRLNADGLPTPVRNGDVWLDGSGNVVVRSGGVSVVIA